MNVWFGRMLGYEWPTLDQWYFHPNVANDPGLSLWCYEREYILQNFRHYRAYFFIRNPYERFYSHLLAHRLYQDLTFPEAVREALSATGIRPHPMFNEVSAKVLDTLDPEFVHFDDIPATLRGIRSARGITVDFETSYASQEYVHSDLVHWPGAREVPLRELDLSPGKGQKIILPSYRAVYDEETAGLVHAAYAIDFQKFDYSKNFRIRNALVFPRLDPGPVAS